MLYLGTERGVMFSPDDGATWQPLQLNLPTVAVHDLAVKDDDLVVGTHGRSIWILDDLAAPARPVATGPSRASPSHLFAVAGRRPLDPDALAGATAGTGRQSAARRASSTTG